jgi:abhydrolase domain-containing protein 10
LPIFKAFAEESVVMELDTSKPLEIKCPVKIIHGVKDETVPYEKSLKVMQLISNDNVELTYQKDGDHRLSSDTSLELILRSLDDMLSKI